jgi:geranylgeranyl diphosphate synthase, type I
MTNWYVAHFSDMIGEIEAYLYDFRQSFPQSADLYWDMVDHHFNWTTRATIQASGKRLRPVMALLVGQALSDGAYSHVLPAAAGIEMIHNFTLIHDDIMDGDEVRRGRPTVWKTWDVNQAINAGDGLYTMGLLAVVRAAASQTTGKHAAAVIETIVEACLKTVEGQVLDLSFEDQLTVSLEAYMLMIERKSGDLIRASARVGALLSTDDLRIVDAYADFALNLGVAFQIWDDYLGIWGDADQTGKSSYSDILNKKKSYPVLYALRATHEENQANLKQIYSQERITMEDLATVQSILEDARAKTHTTEQIDIYFRKSMAALESTRVENDYQDTIKKLAAFFVQREY